MATTTRGARFWLVFLALCFCVLLSALDLAGVSTAAPTIVAQLHGSDFSWIGSAYTLSSAACLPLSGNLAQIFGRKHITILMVVLFGIGSAVSGSAHSMSVLIVGRAIQGLGGGGTQALVSIVTADLVPLRERGTFTGITGMIWTLGSITGPFIAGGLTQKATWRWLFSGDHRLDWNPLIISSSTSCMLGLTWGGGRFAWSSPEVLAPLIIGLVGLGLSLIYEIKVATHPTIPRVILANRGSQLGYLLSFIHGVVSLSITFYALSWTDPQIGHRRPTWFQSVRAATPIQSGLYFLPMVATISPFAVIEGLIVAKFGHYRLVNLVGWAVFLLGVGLFIDLHRTTSLGLIVLFQLIQGVGMVLAPLPVSENASALSLLTFVRTFSQSWGIAIVGSVIQNKLRSTLPALVIQQFRSDLVYGVIPEIPRMPEALKVQVQDAREEEHGDAAGGYLSLLVYFGNKLT
ncbi:MFS general substrate transporter [Mycena filopes]|nr:MFS general substrate transporter [Mycena filopes]